MESKPRVHAGVYYWPSAAACEAYAHSAGVTLAEPWRHDAYPQMRRWAHGFAIQLDRAGAYLGVEHVKLSSD